MRSEGKMYIVLTLKKRETNYIVNNNNNKIPYLLTTYLFCKSEDYESYKLLQASRVCPLNFHKAHP